MQIEHQDFVQYLTIKKGLYPNSIRNYSGKFLMLKRWLVANNSELTKESIEKFLYRKKEIEKLSNSTVNGYIQALDHLEDYCKDRGMPIGFMDGIESLPKTSPEIKPLTPEELESLLNTHLGYKNRNGVDCKDLDGRYLLLTEFLAITGCRFEEAASLKVKRLDIENERAYIVNTKNKQNRYVFFKGIIKERLKITIEGKNDEDLVFTNSKGQHFHPGDFNNDLRLRAKKAGITKRVHAHILRHSFGTSLYKMTHDVFSVKEILGHKDVKSTQIYVNLDTEYLQRAAQRHPLMRKYVEPTDILKDIKSAVDEFRIDKDERFSYNVSIGNAGLEIQIVPR